MHRMQFCSLVALLLLALAPAAGASPKSFLKTHWKPIVTIVGLSGAAVADSVTTCQHSQYQEQRFGRGCNTAIGIDLGIVAGGTASYLWARHANRNIEGKGWQAFRDFWLVPAITYGAVHDYKNAQLGPAPK
jgi:hypothetical protein